MTTHVKRIDYPMDGIPVPMLVAADAESHENISKCKRDVVYRIVPKRENNPRFQRMVERMIRDLFENQDQYETEAAHRTAVKVAIGWVEDEEILTPPTDRKRKAAKWCRETAIEYPLLAPVLTALAGLLEEPVVQYATKPLDFGNCGQDEREEFLELLKPYYGERLGWDRLASYEGGI